MNNTKKAILESAIKVFSNSGYDSSTMDEIAANAGVAKGTLYYHFKSKEEIFKYIIKEGIKRIKQQLDEATEDKNDALSKLKSLSRIQLSMVYQNRDLFKVIMSQLWGQELRQLELREDIRQYIKYIEKYLEQAMEEGSIKKGEKSFMAYTLFGVLCSAAVYELINNTMENLDEVIDKLMQYILKGIQL